MPAFDGDCTQPGQPGVGAVAGQVPEGDRRDVRLDLGLLSRNPGSRKRSLGARVGITSLARDVARTLGRIVP